MFLHEFNTDKMLWEKYELGSTSFKLAGLVLKFNDEQYFKDNLHILKNLINKNCKLILVDHTRTNTYYLNIDKLQGYDIVNNKFVNNPSKDNVFVVCLTTENPTNFTDLNNYWLYLQYE